LSVAEGRVTFRYKDYAAHSRSKTMTLSGEEFLRRFMQHVLPKGFVKIRHYGLLAARGRNERLALCRRLLLPATVAAHPSASSEEPGGIRPVREPWCPHCGGQRLSYYEFNAEEALRHAVVAADSS
jgi:Putative transposase